VNPVYYQQGQGLSFSAMVSGGGNVVVTPSNGGVTARGANVNYDVFVTPPNIGESDGSAHGFGASSLQVTVPNAQATAGALFVVPNGDNLVFRDIQTMGTFTFARFSQPPFDTPANYYLNSGTAQVLHVHVENCNLNNNGHAFQFNGATGNFFIEDCFVHGPNSQDPSWAAFYMSDVPPLYPGQLGLTMEQFRIGTGVDIVKLTRFGGHFPHRGEGSTNGQKTTPGVPQRVSPEDHRPSASRQSA
jgi:hypothetical protein